MNNRIFLLLLPPQKKKNKKNKKLSYSKSQRDKKNVGLMVFNPAKENSTKLMSTLQNFIYFKL